MPALDGLRAVAIAAVVLFHLDPRWLPGGFLGVDVFFVVSGFLITTLLVTERRAHGRVDLVGFWTRRARRLLPALLVCVPASILLARAVETDLLVAAGRQALGALTFSTNWLEIRAGSDYFDQTSPQLFMNFWSLAVEEQFYLVWPFVVLLALALPLRPRHRVAAVAGVGVASALLMAVLLDPDGSATRVYYGTDTHLAGLMFGAALAFALAGPPGAWFERGTWRRWRGATVLAGWVVLVTLLLVCGEDRTFTFRGGILLASLASTALVAGAVTGGGTRTFLSSPALTWVGRRSYGLYLWHWPVLLIVGQDIPTAPGSAAYLLSRAWCVLVTVALADLSYRLVETPVRRHGFRQVGRRVARAIGHPSGRAFRLAVGGLAVTSLATAGVIATAPDRSSTERILEANATAATTAATTARAATPTTTTSPETSGPTTWTRLADYSMPSGDEIDGFGDSMMVGSLHALRYYFPGIRLDARSNRRWSDGLREVRAAGPGTRRAVVLAYGTNAGVDAKTVRAVLEELGPRRLVVLVNLHARFSRIEGDNATLAAVAADYRNVAVADWDTAVSRHPDQLQPDGIHPSITGAHLYSATIRSAFADLSEHLTGKAVHLPELPLP